MRVVVGALVLGTACVAPQPQGSDDPAPSDDGVAATSPDRPEDLVLDTASDPGAARVRPVRRRASSLASSCTDNQGWCEVSQATGLRAASPAYGRGATVVDVDGDGFDDLWQGHARNPEVGADRGAVLWQNRADGTFTPLDLGLPIVHSDANWGTTWADWDDDGDADVLFTNGGYDGEGRLFAYRNELDTMGRFVEVTEAIGITTARASWWGASFADYDRDGDLDLVVSARSAIAIPPCCCGGGKCPLPGGDPAPAPLPLYQNQGDGTFVDVSAAMGLTPVEIDAHLPVWWDYDDDGWEDLFVPNMGEWSTYAGPSAESWSHVRLYRNLQGQGFVDVAEEVLPAFVLDEGPVFGVAPLDVDQDGRRDLYVGRAWMQPVVLRAVGDGTVELLGREIGLDTSSDATVAVENTMGLGVGDVDADGCPDVLVGPGSPDLKGYPTTFVNGCAAGRVAFTRLDDTVIPMAYGQHHGSAVGDLDLDGDVEMFWNMGGFSRFDLAPWGLPPGVRRADSRQQPLLFTRPGRNPHTVSVRLRGTASSADPIGARVRVDGGVTRYLWVEGTVGFASRNSSWLTLPTGGADEVVVTIDWPSGQRTVNRLEAGARVWLDEP